MGNSNKLDQLQLEAARIVTGLPIFASSILIYKELSWESLTERRKRRKLQMFYNIQNNNAPMYLCDLIPPSIQSTTVYPLRYGCTNFILSKNNILSFTQFDKISSRRINI